MFIGEPNSPHVCLALQGVLCIGNGLPWPWPRGEKRPIFTLWGDGQLQGIEAGGITGLQTFFATELKTEP